LRRAGGVRRLAGGAQLAALHAGEHHALDVARRCSRIGQALSQARRRALSAVLQLAAVGGALAVEGHHQRRGLAIQARLWNRPTAQPKRQNRCRASGIPA
jgi:hypothetical protein